MSYINLELELEGSRLRLKREIYIYIWKFGLASARALGFHGMEFGVSTEVRVRIRAGGYDRNELGALATKSTIARLHIPYHHIYIWYTFRIHFSKCPRVAMHCLLI